MTPAGYIPVTLANVKSGAHFGGNSIKIRNINALRQNAINPEKIGITQKTVEKCKN